MTPAIRAIRRSYPSGFLACLVPPRCREVLVGNPHLDAVLLFDERGADRGPLGWLKLIRLLKPYHFDTAFLFHRSFTRTLCVTLAGVPKRIGYTTWKRRGLLTTPTPMPAKDTVHKVDLALRVVEAGGIPADGRSYDFVVSDADRQVARELLQAAGCQPDRPTVALHAGANWHPKRWPPKLFARLGDRLVKEHGAHVLLVGSADDRPLAEGIARRMEHPPILLCGQTTLPQLGALFAQVDCVISNDSGPLHVAAAVGARTIGLFGPTTPGLTGPPPAPHIKILLGSIGCPVPCYRQWCPVNLCMRQVTPERVLEVVKEWLPRPLGGLRRPGGAEAELTSG